MSLHPLHWQTIDVRAEHARRLRRATLAGCAVLLFGAGFFAGCLAAARLIFPTLP